MSQFQLGLQRARKVLAEKKARAEILLGPLIPGLRTLVNGTMMEAF